MLNRKHFAIIAIIAIFAIVTISSVHLMGATAEEKEIRKVNEVKYDAIMPLIVDMKPGETKTIPAEIRAESALDIDLFISAKGKEFIARNNIDEPKFTEGVSATISKQHSSFDTVNQSDLVDIVVTVSDDADVGQYPLTLTMKQKIADGSNLVQQYLYINVE